MGEHVSIALGLVPIEVFGFLEVLDTLEVLDQISVVDRFPTAGSAVWTSIETLAEAHFAGASCVIPQPVFTHDASCQAGLVIANRVLKVSSRVVGTHRFAIQVQVVPVVPIRVSTTVGAWRERHHGDTLTVTPYRASSPVMRTREFDSGLDDIKLAILELEQS